jgi:GLPGLI family protein
MCTSVLLLAGFCAFGQFEGKVVYEVKYQSNDPTASAYLSMLPNESTLTIKGTRSRFEQTIAGGAEQLVVTDAATKSTTLVMNFMGQKFQVKLNGDSLQMLRKNEPLQTIETSDTKEILGMQCKKALAISGKDTIAVYYSEALHPHSMIPQLADIKGIPMEYGLIQNNISMHFKAKKIVKGPVDNSVFEISPEIKEVPFAQFAKSFAVAN